MTPIRSAGTRTVTLPGSLEPIQETTVYARTNGYVRRFLVDIGDAVKTGQVLAEIDAPEVDQELAQARAAANQSTAILEQARTRSELRPHRDEALREPRAHGSGFSAGDGAASGDPRLRASQRARSESVPHELERQHPSLGRPSAVLRGHRALQRHGHVAHDRSRSARNIRPRRGRGPISSGQRGYDARVRVGTSTLCSVRSRGRESEREPPGVYGPLVRGNHHAHRERTRLEDADAAHRSAGRQRLPNPHRRHVCDGQFPGGASRHPLARPSDGAGDDRRGNTRRGRESRGNPLEEDRNRER